MSNNSTKKMLRMFEQGGVIPPQMFLASFFKSPAGNFYNSESVEIDIERSDEDISIAITDLSTGYRYNTADIYTNKEFKAPIFKEAAPLNAFDMIKRQAGQDPFTQPNFQANATKSAMKMIRKMVGKIRRTSELQASQVLTTGVVTLLDEDGNAAYTVDYKPKATHFPTAGTAWDQAGADPIADLESLSEVIRNDGLIDSKVLAMGTGSFEAFLDNAKVLARFDNRRMELGRIAPAVTLGAGGQFRGTISIGTYTFEIWTYGNRYVEPSTGIKTKYLPDDKVIVTSNDVRMDATFGAIPRIVSIDKRALPYLPSRVSNSAEGRDLDMNAWVSNDGEQLFVGVGSRPLLIPTQIDGYGCLDTGI